MKLYWQKIFFIFIQINSFLIHITYKTDHRLKLLRRIYMNTVFAVFRLKPDLLFFIFKKHKKWFFSFDSISIYIFFVFIQKRNLNREKKVIFFFLEFFLNFHYIRFKRLKLVVITFWRYFYSLNSSWSGTFYLFN